MDNRRLAQVAAMYEKRYEIRFCRKEEADVLMAFLDRYWKKGHILSKNKRLLDWQYLDERYERYNFILAVCREDGEIHGIMGFIPTDLFDAEIATPMRWGAIWKVREDVATKGLGLAMKFYMYQYAPAPYAGGIGLSAYSKSINAKLGEEMGVLKHYYMINNEKKEFCLIKNLTSCCQIPVRADGPAFLETDEQSFSNHERDYAQYLLPYKSTRYYINRYFRHPMYQYHCGSLQNERGENAFLFYRLCCHDAARCIMVVDFIGQESALQGAESAFAKLLVQYDAEYLSFYEYGMDDAVLTAAGLSLKTDTEDGLILPLYYEPFVQKNVLVDYHYFNDDSVVRKVFFFKGDADQDRPNEERENAEA